MPLRLLLPSFLVATCLVAPALDAQAPPQLATELADAAVTLDVTGTARAGALYQGIAEAASLTLVLDRGLRPVDISLIVRERTAREALDLVTRAAGHFWTALDDHTVLIAEDTPQNRRTHEHQLVATFHLDHMAVKDMMTTLRSLYGLKDVAADVAHRAISLRDSAARVELVAATIDRLDRAPGEVDLDIEVLRLPRRVIADLAENDGRTPLRLPAERARALRQQGDLLAAPSLTAIEGRATGFRLDETLPWSGERDTRVQLRFDLRARVDAQDRSFTLDLEVEGDLGAPGQAHASRSARSSLHVPPGQAILLTDWLPVGQHGLDQATVLLVVPRAVRPREQTATDAALYVGGHARAIAP